MSQPCVLMKHTVVSADTLAGQNGSDQDGYGRDGSGWNGSGWDGSGWDGSGWDGSVLVCSNTDGTAGMDSNGRIL